LVQEAGELLDGGGVAGGGCHCRRWGIRSSVRGRGLRRRERPGFGLTIWRGFRSAAKREKDSRGAVAGGERQKREEKGERTAEVASHSESVGLQATSTAWD